MSGLVHTPHGPGRIVAEDVVRGRKSFLVEGAAFRRWIDETDLQLRTAEFGDAPTNVGDHADTNEDLSDDLHEDNSTTLPYNPEPQFPVDMFRDEQTIQPTHHIDVDERTSPANSLDFKSESGSPWPAPADHLFSDPVKKSSRTAGLDIQDILPHGMPSDEEIENMSDDEYDRLVDILSMMRDPIYARRQAGVFDNLFGGGGDKSVKKHQQTPEQHQRDMERLKRRHVLETPEEWEEEVSYRPPAGGALRFKKQIMHGPSQQEREETLRQMYQKGELQPGTAEYAEYHHMMHPDETTPPGYVRSDTGDLIKIHPRKPPGRGYFSQHPPADLKAAGLSDKYIDIVADADHFNDPVQRFRDDPMGFIARRGYANSTEHPDIRTAEYADLVEADPSLRQAAWSDVRQKANRLRREGRVDVHDIDDNRILATVRGDHGDYEVAILTGAFGGFGNSSAITSWSCDCGWGKTAFQRQMLHVGRLCSHGLACYNEMQSRQMKNVGRHAGVVEDYSKYVDDENNGHVDIPSLSNYLTQPEDPKDEKPAYTKEEVQQLYDYVNENHSTSHTQHREYDLPYTLDHYEHYPHSKSDPKRAPKESYRHADALRLRPNSLTPDLNLVADEDEEFFTDVEKDERKTTGPEQIQHFSSRYFYADEAPQEDQPDPYRDYSGGGELLEELRGKIDETPSEDFQNMDERNDDIRDVVDELHEKGYEANNLVASRYAYGPVAVGESTGRHGPLGYTEEIEDDPLVWGSNTRLGPQRRSHLHEAAGSLLGEGGPNWMDEPFQGSGADPKIWIGSSDDYVDEHERPRFEDVTDLGDDDIIDYTDHPPQGPGKAASVDPIANFYKSGAADSLRQGSNNSGGRISDDAIAAAAQGFLRTAGRNYSFAEQRELEDETHPDGARNLDGLDLTGTHYVT